MIVYVLIPILIGLLALVSYQWQSAVEDKDRLEQLLWDVMQDKISKEDAIKQMYDE